MTAAVVSGVSVSEGGPALEPGPAARTCRSRREATGFARSTPGRRGTQIRLRPRVWVAAEGRSHGSCTFCGVRYSSINTANSRMQRAVSHGPGAWWLLIL